MAWLEHRIPPPVVTLVFGVMMWLSSLALPPTSLPAFVSVGGGLALLLAAGLLVLPAVRGFRRAGTTVNPIHIERASHLMTTGVYRFTRNPMYLGMVLLLTSVAFFLGSLWTLLGPLLLLLFLTRFQIQPEERALGAIFGQPYRDYRSRVRRWL